jgi:hypothetical protein
MGWRRRDDGSAGSDFICLVVLGLGRLVLEAVGSASSFATLGLDVAQGSKGEGVIRSAIK